MNFEEIKQSKKDMESKIYDTITEFQNKTGLLPSTVSLNIVNQVTLRRVDDILLNVYTDVVI